jgi:hypothetical protein
MKEIKQCQKCRNYMYRADDYYHPGFKGWRCPMCGSFVDETKGEV